MPKVQTKGIDNEQLRALLPVPGFKEYLKLPPHITAEELNEKIKSDQIFGEKVIIWCARFLLLSRTTEKVLLGVKNAN
jgi:hypothetical protein